MYEQPANPAQRPTRRQRLPPWGLFVVLLATTLWLAAQYGLRARQDAGLAPREQHAAGTMTKLTHGKYTTAWYSFTYAGQQYSGKDGVSRTHCFCDVTVYFDPEHPSTNSLVDYTRRTWADHLTMIICLWMSAAFAAILVLAFLKRRRKPAPNYSPVS
jgi:hypothetical protein